MKTLLMPLFAVFTALTLIAGCSSETAEPAVGIHTVKLDIKGMT